MTTLRRDILPLALDSAAAIEADLRRATGTDSRSLRR